MPLPGWYVHTVVLLAVVAGCGPGGGRRLDLEAADPSDRTQAIIGTVEGAKSDPRSGVAPLVDRLEDEDEVVRFFAIAALDRLTGRRLGYWAYEPATRRRLAVERWREYLAATQPVGQDAGP